jgi:uncharacterized protein (TIGR02246 family)
MSRYGLMLAAAVAAGTAVAVTSLDRSPAQDKGSPAAPPPAVTQPDGPEAVIRKLGEEYVKAYNAGDAKAVAAFWTADGEYTDPDGETVRGRAAIEKDFAEFFKAHPKATIETKPGSLRLIGRATAVAEGTAAVRLPGDAHPAETRYSALLVREDDGWKLASVRESETDPATEVTTKNLEWLVGEWAAKGDGGELRITYAWDEGKTFLHGKYALTKDGKPVSSGTQVIGTNPGGGLRSWVFDGSGTFGEGVWVRDGDRWVNEAAGTLPDGTETTAVNILIPLGPDAFTWQSTERTAGEVDLPDSPPVKVTRVKAGK